MWKPCPLTGESSEEERGEVTVQGEEGSCRLMGGRGARREESGKVTTKGVEPVVP